MLAWIIPVSIVGGIVVILLLAVVIWWIATNNKFKRYAVKIDEAASGIDVALTKRYDLLSKSVEVVKGYAKHEAETIMKTTGLRAPKAEEGMKEKSAIEGRLSRAFASIQAVAENYPNLKADTVFAGLQNQVSDAEEQLQSARRIYNSNVSIFNQEIAVFPSSIVARHLHLTPRDFFEAEDRKKEDVEIKF